MSTPASQPVSTTAPGVPSTAAQPLPKMNKDEADRAFREYMFIAEDTAKLTDRRGAFNTMFVTINALFLTGVGYLMYLYFQARNGGEPAFFFVLGFLLISLITTRLNWAWLNLSESSRRLINLRMRYLSAIESALRDSGHFPMIDTRLLGDEAEKSNLKKEFEEPPPAYASTVVIQDDAVGKPHRWMRMRGIYAVETVLYSNPLKRRLPLEFSKAEQKIGHTFTWSYWIAFAIALIFLIPQILILFNVLGRWGPIIY